MYARPITQVGRLSRFYASNCTCFKLETPKELLDKAKVATMEYNRAYSSGMSDSQ